jgi:crotonobetainyl-CoA:carnitine CoA-transferase CaiB-like acyl-CoA transferase
MGADRVNALTCKDDRLCRGGPLQGVRVVELTKVWAGPYVGKMLAFLGAEVIRVESERALDTSRSLGTSDIDLAPGYQAVNPQKLSVQIDTRKPEGRELLFSLLQKTDIFVENLRPGAIERSGLDYQSVRAIRPEIVYVSIGMYGSEGPLAYQSGYAQCFAALSGLTALFGYEGSVPEGMNVRYGDTTTGVTAAFAAVVGLLHRRRTGEGQFVDVSAVEALSSMIGDSIMDYGVNGALARSDGNRHAEMAPHGAYPCLNGEWISIAVASQEQWRWLAQLIGGPELADHPCFRTLALRHANERKLDRIVSGWTAGQHAATLAGLLQEKGVAAAKSLSTVDLVSEPHLWASGFFPQVTDCLAENRPIVGPSWTMTDGARLTHGAPRLGQDNAYVFGDILGLSRSEQEAMAKAGITR